jgi:DNA-binding PadR family transcriptional regulator
VSTESKSFDPRQVIDELIGFVRDRASDVRTRGFSPKPTTQQIERAVLSAISSESKNVTEIVRAISLASGGTWQPTAGQVQTSLSALVETELAASKNKGDRKLYSITKAGVESLAAAANASDTEASASDSTAAKPSSNLSWMTCDPAFLKATSKLGPVLLDITQTGSREQQSRAASILETARHELHVILAEK